MTIEIKAPPTPHEDGDTAVVIRNGLPQSVELGNIIGYDVEDFIPSDGLNSLSSDVAGLSNDVTILDLALTEEETSRLLGDNGYTSRAEAIAATIPAPVIRINVAGLAYVADPAGTAMTTAGGRTWSPDGTPYPDHWGAVRVQSLVSADTAQDAYPAMLAMKDWLYATNYAGTYNLLSGYYRISQTLEFERATMIVGLGGEETRIHATFTAGPAVRFMNTRSGTKDCGVTGSVARRAAPLDFTSPGILYEGVDDVGNTARLLHCKIDDTYVFGHPGSAIHVVGPAYTGFIGNSAISSCKGHGICFDRGQATGRVNLITDVISGIVNIDTCRVSGCGGHFVACGSPSDDFSTPGLRIKIDNMEGGENGQNPAALYANAACYLRGPNFVVDTCGFGFAGASLFVAGRNIHIKNNRVLSNTSGVAIIIGTYDTLPTEDVFIDGLNVINPAAPMNPAVLVTLPTGQTVLPKGIFVTQAKSSQITRLVGTDASMGSGQENRVPGLTLNGRVPLVVKPSDQTVNNSITTVNDTHLTQYLSPNETMYFHAVLQVDSPVAAGFRVQMSAPAGATLEYGTPSSIKVGTDGGSFSTQNEVSSGNIVFGTTAGGSQRYIEIRGRVINGAAAGNLGLKWAQLTATVGDTILKEGSYMSCERVVT